MEIIQGKSTVAEASRAFDLTPSGIEAWVDEVKRGMENPARQTDGHSRAVRKADQRPAGSVTAAALLAALGQEGQEEDGED